MESLLTGLGLSTAAGLNAYIPMLVLGLLARFTDVISLPAGWSWLENGWVLGITAVLLVVEIIADKIPVLDSLNDIVQNVVRPAAGGIVFGSGTAAQTPVADPGASGGGWPAIVAGVLIALGVSLTKTAVRPAANVASAGFAAPVLSTVEDVTSVGLAVTAILLPLLVLLLLVLVLWAAFALWRRRRRRAPARAHPTPASAHPGTGNGPNSVQE